MPCSYLRLDVSMKESLIVHICQCRKYLFHNAGNGWMRQDRLWQWRLRERFSIGTIFHEVVESSIGKILSVGQWLRAQDSFNLTILNHELFPLCSFTSKTKYKLSSLSRITSIIVTMLGWRNERNDCTSRKSMHAFHVLNFLLMCLIATWLFHGRVWDIQIPTKQIEKMTKGGQQAANDATYQRPGLFRFCLHHSAEGSITDLGW